MDDRTPEEIALYERMMKMSKPMLALIVLDILRRKWMPLSAFDEARESAEMHQIQMEIKDLREQYDRISESMKGLIASGKSLEWRELSDIQEDVYARQQIRLDRWHNMMADRRERGRRA
jgi:hypothetical protein